VICPGHRNRQEKKEKRKPEDDEPYDPPHQQSLIKPGCLYVAVCGVLVGLIIPIASLVYIRFVAGAGSLWTVVVWPTSILLLGPEVGVDAPSFGTLCLSIALDGLWYVFLCAVLWSVFWLLSRWRASLRDGTTI
jgi:hypothetical protein